MPSYFKQQSKSTCSLAVLRMVLDTFGVKVSERELLDCVLKDYGSEFKNIWNPTIAKLAREYGIDTTFIALWPLLKAETLPRALAEYTKSPDTFSVATYENRSDTNKIHEPLPLAYSEMFKAVENGCKTVYGKLTSRRLRTLLDTGHLVQASVIVDKLYPGKKPAFHSILVYEYSGDIIKYHDPFYGEKLTCSIEHLLKSLTTVGACMAYRK